MAFSEVIKTKVRKRGHLACCICKSMCFEVHHVIPQSECGTDVEENAALLCPSCHKTYGANPQRRRFILDARDSWYEACETRFGNDHERLDEIKRLLKCTVSFDDFLSFKEDLLAHIQRESTSLRNADEIFQEIDILLDRLWYHRHLRLRQRVETGRTQVAEDVWAGALKSAGALEQCYGRENLGQLSDFELGMLNGKLSALRWVRGANWDRATM